MSMSSGGKYYKEMKALEKTIETLENAIQILNDTKSAFFDDHDVYMGYTKHYFNKVTSGLLSHIAELEVLQQSKSCNGCIDALFPLPKTCSNCERCKADLYRAKEQ